MATIHEFPTAAELEELTTAEPGDFPDAYVSFDIEEAEASLDLVEVSRPLYVLEEEVGILLDSAGLEGAALEPEVFLADLASALRAAVAKRDAVANFMAHLEGQIKHASEEIERLSGRREVYSAALERIKGYVLHVLESIGRDGRGRPPRLEGTTTTMTLRACPGSVSILDEAAIPESFKLTTVTLPAELWAETLDALEVDLRARVEEACGGGKSRVSLSAVGRAIKDGVKVDGAEMLLGKNSLVRK